MRPIGVGIASLILAMPLVAAAQVDGRLAAYTGRNAKGYLSPLVDSFRSGLNAGLFHSAEIPAQKFYVSFEVNAMATFFDEDSRSFMATTEGNFLPQQTTSAPTIVGDDHAVFVDGTAGTQYAFPGGFEIHNIYYACPQVRVGSWRGTEALGRFVYYDTNTAELGALTFWGAGIRHSISQYFPSLHPLDVALAGTWQDGALQNDAGQKVLHAQIFTASLQSGMQVGVLYPYAGLSMDWFDMQLDYVFPEEWALDPFHLDFDYNTDFQLTLGVAYHVSGFSAYGEYSLADESSVAAGLSVTFPFTNRSATP